MTDRHDPNGPGDSYESSSEDRPDPETVNPHRQSARTIVSPVVDDVELIERGHWRVTATGQVGNDVMTSLYIEDFRVGEIAVVDGNRFHFDVHENYSIEDEERHLSSPVTEKVAGGSN